MSQTQTQKLDWIKIHYSAIAIVGTHDTLYLDAEEKSINLNGMVVDTLSTDSIGVLESILDGYAKFSTHSRIFAEDFSNDHSDSDLIQSLLILCDSLRESCIHPQIIEILDCIQSARMQSV